MRRRSVQVTRHILVVGMALAFAATPAQAAAPQRAPAASSASATVYLIRGVDATTMALNGRRSTVDGRRHGCSEARRRPSEAMPVTGVRR